MQQSASLSPPWAQRTRQSRGQDLVRSTSSFQSASGGPLGASPTSFSSSTPRAPSLLSSAVASLSPVPSAAYYASALGAHVAHGGTPPSSATRPSVPTATATDTQSIATESSKVSISSSRSPGEKRTRVSESAADDSPRRWVHFVAFDAPLQPVLVDTHLLRDAGSRSWLMVQHETPHLEMQAGMPTWRITSMSRAMLVAMLKCLVHHEFILPKDVDYHEAIRALESEAGIGVPGGTPEAAGMIPTLTNPPHGIGMRRRQESTHSTVTHVCTLIANAIEEWPRLAIGMASSLDWKSGEAGFACTTSRCWVRFAERPKIEPFRPDHIYWLAKKKPYWLQATMTSIGYIHYRMVKEKQISGEVFNEETFSKLSARIEGDSTHWFLSAKRDMQRHARDEDRAAIRHADRFTHSALRAVDERGGCSEERLGTTASTSSSVEYYRAVVVLAEELVRSTPNLARLFTSECADDKGQTHERATLEKVLKARSIKVVAWKDTKDSNIKPLVFPPSFMSHIHSGGACALLDFTERESS